MHLEAVCTSKTLSIGFRRFPARIRSYAGHDALSALLVAAIPEIDGNGLDGGIYRQTMYIWIEISCEGMLPSREAKIREDFVRITKEHCRLKCASRSGSGS